MPQLKILMLLACCPGCSAQKIATKLKVKAANITFLLDQLEKKKLVKRNREAFDRRMITPVLTDRGTRLINSFFRSSQSYWEEKLDKLSDEDKEALYRGLKALVKELP